MRYVLAIAAFAAAIVLIVLGIGQRTFLAGPSTISTSIEIEDGAHYAYLPSSVLQSHPGRQAIKLSGSDVVFFAYGRSADVRAWLADYPYNRITLGDDGQLTAELIEPEDPTETPATPTPTPAPTDGAEATTEVEEEAPAAGTDAPFLDPAGSDLWLQEYRADAGIIQPVALPPGMAVIIASDGVSPAPATIGINWPTDGRTPWAGPLLVAGLVMAVLGVFLYLLAIDHARRMRGPRRGDRRRLAGLRRRQVAARPAPATGAIEPPADPPEGGAR